MLSFLTSISCLKVQTNLCLNFCLQQYTAFASPLWSSTCWPPPAIFFSLLSSPTLALSHQEDGCVAMGHLCDSGPSPRLHRWLFSMYGENHGPSSLPRSPLPWALWMSVSPSTAPWPWPTNILSLSMLGSPQRAHWPPAFIVSSPCPQTPRDRCCQARGFYWHLFWSLKIVLFHIFGFTILLWMMMVFHKTQM